MLLCKTPNLSVKFFDEQMIVFAPNTGQTHCLDSCVNEILILLNEVQPTPLSQIIDLFINDASGDIPNNEKSMITDYINGMIDDLLALDLVIEH